jgi:hypothetical protein
MMSKYDAQCDLCEETYQCNSGDCGTFNIDGIGEYNCCDNCTDNIKQSLVHSGKIWDHVENKYVNHPKRNNGYSDPDVLFYPTASFLDLLDDRIIYLEEKTKELRNLQCDLREHIHPTNNEMIDIREQLYEVMDKNLVSVVLDYFSVFSIRTKKRKREKES